MTMEEKHHRQFCVVKYVAERLVNQEFYYPPKFEDMFRTYRTDMTDIQTLYKVMCELAETRNSKLKTRLTLIQNMKYSTRYMRSAVFNGLNISTTEINKLIDENPTMEVWQLSKLVKT